MKILKDESAQVSAELILLFGGIIVIALVMLIAYRNYIAGIGNAINGTQLQNTTNSIKGLKNLF